jgi:hypothetical protein
MADFGLNTEFCSWLNGCASLCHSEYFAPEIFFGE